MGQISDGVDAQGLELPGEFAPHIEQIAHRHGPDQGGHGFRGKTGGGVGLLVVAAQLGKHLAEGHPHRHRDAQLRPDPGPDLVRRGFGIHPQQMEGAGQIQIALVDAGGLHQVGVVQKDLIHGPGDPGVGVPVGGDQHQSRAFAPGLPDGLCGLNPFHLGQLILGQNDTVAALRVPGHRHGHLLQLRPQQTFAGGKEIVAVHVEDDPVLSGGDPMQLSSGLWVRVREMGHTLASVTAIVAAPAPESQASGVEGGRARVL